jgi:hypothetical protein
VPPRPLDAAAHERVEAQLLALLAVLGPPREADDVGDQPAEVLELGRDVAEQAAPALGVEGASWSSTSMPDGG